MCPGSMTISRCHTLATSIMRIFLLILSAVIPSQTSKEHTIYGDLSRDGENIFFELVKRLGKEDDHGQLDWENKARCDWTPNKSSIIKKKESLNNGAIFLTLYKDVESNEACSARCCQNGSCDLAVFENKENHYCYLFQCEGKCKFGHHSSYVSNDIVHHSQPQTSIAEGSEQDLIDLNQGSESKSLNNNAFETTAAVTTLSPTTALYIPPHSVGLEGPYCEETLHCEDPSAICSYHRCVCQEGFYRKGHICREVCPPSNFECLELGTHGRGPQCVSQLEVCNSITQCADGSDEYNCPDSGAFPIKTWQQQLLHTQAQPAHQQSPLEQPQQQHENSPVPQYKGQGRNASETDEINHLSNPTLKEVGKLDDSESQDDQDGLLSDSDRFEQQQFQLYGQPPVNSLQPHVNSPAINLDTNHNDGNFKKQLINISTKEKDSTEINQQQPSEQKQIHEDSELLKLQHISGLQQTVKNTSKQLPDSHQQYPISSQEMHQSHGSKQTDYKPGSQQNLKVQQSSNYPQYLHQQSNQNFSSVNSQQHFPSRGSETKQKYAANSKKLSRPKYNGAQSLSDIQQPKQGDVFMQGVVPVDDQKLSSEGQQILPKKVHGSFQLKQNVPQRLPNLHKVAPSAAYPGHPETAIESESVAGIHSHGLHSSDISPEVFNNQKAYLMTGESQFQNQPQFNDARVGEPDVPIRRIENSQKSFGSPTDLNNLEEQRPSHFLNNYGDQYLPQQNFRQQYSPYNRHAYAMNSGSQGSIYPGMSNQLSQGVQNQRIYPQQGYLESVYPSNQYEFGEFEPSYPETESYPESHDAPLYRPSSKLGYEEPSKGHGLPSPERKPAQYGGSNSQKTDASSEAEKNAKPRVDNESGVDIISHNTDSIQPSNDTDHPSSSMKEGDKDTASKSSSVTTSAAHKTGDVPEKSSKENALKSVEKNTSVSGSLQPDENFVSRKKMNFSLKSASMQGPIIALSLGLAFTVILLIFVVCRLRTVRQRLRKGRPLHSNEADYLINGMYL